MTGKIKKELNKVEKENDIVILLAIESGSRGWGFASTDSDYDIRFIYIHGPEWYLSIDERRDVIEYPVNNLLDISGWDIRKTLKLFRKSNPPLLEWLQSPVIYIERADFAENLRKLTTEYFSPKSCMYHYLNMASGNYRNYLQRQKVRVKKYFYVLRPILACSWIEKNNKMPPMEFALLLNSQIEKGELKNEIEKLLDRKKAGEELDKEPRIEIINQFLEQKINYFTDLTKKMKLNSKPNTNILDNLFRKTLKKTYGMIS